MSQIIKIPRLKDKAIIDCFKEIAENLSAHSPSANLSLLGSASINFDPQQPEQNQDIADLIKKNSELIFSLSFSAGGFSARLYRGGAAETKSPYTDDINLAPGNNCKLTESEKIELGYTIIKKLKAIEPGRTVGSKGSKEQEELASIHEATLKRLEELSEKLISDNHEYREKLDLLHEHKQNSLEEEFKEKDQTLKKEYQELKDLLQEKEQEFENRKQELDSKSNTHARRQIRKDIIGEIKKRQTEFKLTSGTNKLRTPIALAMLGLIAVFVVLSGFSIRDFYHALTLNNTSALWIPGIKQIVYSFGAVGSILFYIRWQNRWFEQHSLAEFHLKQLELDMERASWIVETSLEWNDAKGNSIPPELLDSLSRNLFTPQGEKVENLVHPADQLASAIMGTASMVKLKTGNTEVEIDPRKLRKVKTEIDTNNQP
ncbi:hypothetical protein VUJ49_06125 [Pseudomonas berkeleyensis]|uniref:Uncharacterized protein n=1 Tax=Pseudomonas berkeleyensis TaxID=2726956 RepID=A0A7G5DSA8_9PSED|nr:hypothetical protein [Pseudomonas berkeleyensis]QMV64633.1 hypothetical protein HS968_06110 [Pseudomonas berkeleyensis]WSO40101.1 hypothetical protein VUJ49_06125 [Pseudomonas berkeleyensis]